MNKNSDLKTRFSELNSETASLFQFLFEKYDVLEIENKTLKEHNHKNLDIHSSSKYGIVNLSKVNEESLFDAIKHFNKKCPYCKSDLYEGNIRKKIEVDHFFPIAKGGQDIPWNLLPTCKECNRKKKDKLPYDYLDEFIYNECQNNLVTVLQKTTNIHEDKLQREEIVYNLVSSYGNKKINDKEFIISLCKLYNINMKKKVEIQLEHVNNNVSKNKKARFLDLYTQNKNINISKTCKLLGVSRSTIYNWITEVEK
jgi:hypothetical protein